MLTILLLFAINCFDNRFRRSRWVLALCLVLLPTQVFAQDLFPAIPAGEDNIVTLMKGAPAPFNGQLFDANTAIRWGLWLQQAKDRSQIEAERSKAVCNAELNYKDQVATIEAEKAAAMYQDLMSRYKTAEEKRASAERALSEPPFYKTATFQFSLGVLSTVAAIIVVHKAF